MRLVTVGTGTAAPHPLRVQSSLYLEADDVRLLVDCGSAAVFRLASLGLPWQELTHVAITHFHADHTSDLATLLFAWRHGMLPPRQAPVTILGPTGISDLLARHAAALGASMLEAVPGLRIEELVPGTPVELGDTMTLEARKVPHTDESVAYSVSAKGRRVVVTGDTAFDPELAQWARGCDVFVCECSLPEVLALPTHLTPRQCGELAATVQPGLLALTHFYPPVESVDIVAEVRERFGGNVVMCHDGWEHEI
ncbi:MAG: MBL fold metallo-hydrolase [Gemmatimonadaceae bacterium]